MPTQALPNFPVRAEPPVLSGVEGVEALPRMLDFKGRRFDKLNANGHGRRLPNCHGMTLIEVLVAFVVLSLSLAVIMQIFSGGMRNARLAGSYSQAVFLAQSRLAAVGLEQPIAVGEGSGQSGPDLHWRVTVDPYDDGGAADRLLLPSRLYQVRVRVNWGEEGRDRQVELASLRLGPRR